MIWQPFQCFGKDYVKILHGDAHPPPHRENIDWWILNFTYFKLIIPTVL